MSFLEPEQLLKVLIGYNPWWITGSLPRESIKPVKRVAFYEIQKLLGHPLRRIIFLSGARRVGKTTLIYQTIAQLLEQGVPGKNILYVSFDHPLLKFFHIGQILDNYLSSIAPSAGTLYLFFDEIQYATDWEAWLKTIYDQHPHYRILATGSASPLLTQKITESGVGRWLTIKIPTLSFYEYLLISGIKDLPPAPESLMLDQLSHLPLHDYRQLMLALMPLQQYLPRYLLIGGFPELVVTDDIPFAQRILREDVTDKVLKRDMTALFGTRNVLELEKIFLYLCLHSGNIIVQETIAKEIQIARQTVSNYINQLEQANLIYISHPIDQYGKKMLKSKPKVYIADAALRNAVLLLNETVLANADEMGIIVETTVYKHVLTYYQRNLPRMGYYRDKRQGKEVDIVVDLPTGRLLVEVKYRQNATLQKDDALWNLAGEKNVLGAILVTRQAEDFGYLEQSSGTRIIKIPAHAFLYLTGWAERVRAE